MTVTWVTQEKPTGKSSVIFYESGDETKSQTATGKWKKFEAGKDHTIYVHRVLLCNLSPGTTYHYRVVDSGCESRKKYLFRTFTQNISPKLLVYGDLGTVNGVSVPNLIGEIENQNADAVFHVGDMAYDMPDDEGRNGDKFMRMIEPIAANVAYQVLPGNHESGNNFSHYDHLFSNVDSTSGERNNFYYSTNIGPLHIISITTEFYFYTGYGTDQIQSQYNWLVNDLREATKSANRKVRPWIIVMTHRPMYCSADRSHCLKEVHTLRDGIRGEFGLEDLLHKFKVDLYIAGHAHIYERSYPLFREQVVSNSSDPYYNPKGLVHVTTGSAGCDEELNKFQKVRPQWTAKRLLSYGYMRLTADRNHIHMQQITDQDGRVIDEFQISKD